MAIESRSGIENPAQAENIDAFVRRQNRPKQFLLALTCLAGAYLGEETLYKHRPDLFPDAVVEFKDEFRSKKEVERELSRSSPERRRAIERIRENNGYTPTKEILAFKSVENEAERRQALKEAPAITFENMGEIFPELTEQDVKLVMSECLPKGFNVKKVSFKDEGVPMPSRYNSQKTDVVNLEAAHADQEGNIVFTGGIKDCKPGFVLETLGHETGHCGDPYRNKYLTLDERLWVHGKIDARLKQADRFKSGYVEGINNRNKHVEHNTKASEYFAEVIANYIKDKASLSRADREIVEFVIKRVDPGFDINYANRIFKLMESRLHLKKALALNSRETKIFLKQNDSALKKALASKKKSAK